MAGCRKDCKCKRAKEHPGRETPLALWLLHTVRGAPCLADFARHGNFAAALAARVLAAYHAPFALLLMNLSR
jgi:hypothetical protein